MTAMREFRIQLKDLISGEIIQDTGGTCHVSQAGLPDKQTLYDKNGAALTNPLQLTAGFINFFTLDTVASVDLYIQAPGGQFLTRTGIVASGPNEIRVPTHIKRQMYKIPFSAVDQGGNATETDTGFDLPAKAFVLDRLHGCGLLVTTVHAAKTIDFGTGQVNPAETGGDANGLIAASSVATAGLVIGTNGALFSSNAPAASDANAAKSLTYTLSTGSTTAKGFILLPVQLS